MLSPDQPGSEGCPPKICAGEVLICGENEGHVLGGMGSVDRSTNPFQQVHYSDQTFAARTCWIDLSFPQQREESDHGVLDPIQVSSLGLPNEPSSPSGGIM